MRNQLEMCQLAIAKFVQDLARLCIAIVVASPRLKLSQHFQRTGSKLGIDDHCLQRDDQSIATEQRHEPRQPSGRHEHHVVSAFQGQPERGHVLDALIVATIKLLIARLDFQHGAPPLLHVVNTRR
jgi:hypothetical protein